MTIGTVRLQALSDITRRPREAIRNAQKLGAAPWDEEEFTETSQRRYDGFHALALVLAEGLMAQKCSMELAGEFVRAHHEAISLFLHETTEGSLITPRFVLGLQRGIEDSLFGVSWMPVSMCSYGTEEEILSAIEAEIKAVSRVSEAHGGHGKRRIISGPWIATVSIPEAYRLLKVRAEAAGFVVDGRRIYKIAKDDSEA
ncbi:hypothetical protein [Falsigemmobacter faecalis]|uniref:Uncharacterized protein n=1 Tax=Falsigemmobacter faecalis TaxID=2488730 RepID=A0A3P3D1J9_9RHOB|nr:hypothetical protein [Falsigemmobacter faecalis]RRH68327.1 hypothetical protein EG244_19580 [Falsigemmobacter faecalis]